jgi:hypothetical protein
VSSRRVRAAVVVGLVLASLPFLVAASDGNGGESAAAKAEHQRIIDFWTPARVAQAVPRDFYLDLSSGQYLPAKRPGGGGGGGGGGGSGSGVVSGSSWTKGGAIATATGKVLFEMDGTYYVCSAVAIDDPASNNRSLVLTAAHCVYDETTGQFALNWVFIPDYDAAPAPLTTSGSFCSSTAYGCWTPLAMVVDSGFTSAGGFNDQAVLYDFAVVAVGQGGLDGNTLLEQAVATEQPSFSTDANGNPAGYAFGYPAEKKWHGNDLIYCKGPIDTDPNTANATYRLNQCDLNGGSSGGPWLVDFNESTGVGTVISLNSYGYRGTSAIFGPMLDADTQVVYSTAALDSTQGETIVGG